MAVSQAGADELLQDGLGNGHHHGRGGGVAEPHGEEHCAAHEAEHQPEWERGTGIFARDRLDVDMVKMERGRWVGREQKATKELLRDYCCCTQGWS